MNSTCRGLVCINKGPQEPGHLLGVLLKQLYPGRVGQRGARRPALRWSDYSLVVDDHGATVADQCIEEFWVRFMH